MNKAINNILIPGFSISKNISKKDVASNTQCTAAGAVKKLKGGTVGIILSIIHNRQPIIFVIPQKRQVICKTTDAINFIAQPEMALANIRKILPKDPFKLGALNTLTTLMGSALLAIALYEKAFSQDEIWHAAHVEEDYQIKLWGSDDEAEARRTARYAEFKAAISLMV